MTMAGHRPIDVLQFLLPPTPRQRNTGTDLLDQGAGTWPVTPISQVLHQTAATFVQSLRALVITVRRRPDDMSANPRGDHLNSMDARQMLEPAHASVFPALKPRLAPWMCRYYELINAPGNFERTDSLCLFQLSTDGASNGDRL